MNLAKSISLTLGASIALLGSSCSVCTRTAVADMARSADAILLPLEHPTLYNVEGEWYIGGHKTLIERYNSSWVNPEQLPAEKSHPERYSIADDEFTDTYAQIPEEMAANIRKGKYTYSDAISFINRKWIDQLPEQKKIKKYTTKANAPAFFRNMSSHRLVKSEQGNTYLLAEIGELTADFSSIFIYPLAGITGILVDMPASFLYSPPAPAPQTAQAEEVE